MTKERPGGNGVGEQTAAHTALSGGAEGGGDALGGVIDRIHIVKQVDGGRGFFDVGDEAVDEDESRAEELGLLPGRMGMPLIFSA